MFSSNELTGGYKFMSSFTLPDDTPIDEYLADADLAYEAQKSASYLKELLNYPLQGISQLGRSQSRYNGARRINVAKLAEPRIVRSPAKFLTILKLLQYEANIVPSYGLKVKKGARYDYIHYVLDLNETTSVGVFFFGVWLVVTSGPELK